MMWWYIVPSLAVCFCIACVCYQSFKFTEKQKHKRTKKHLRSETSVSSPKSGAETPSMKEQEGDKKIGYWMVQAKTKGTPQTHHE